MKKVVKIFGVLTIVLAGIVPVNYAARANEEVKKPNVQIVADDIKVNKDDEEFTLLDGIPATDEQGNEVEVSVLDDGLFDITVTGEYTVIYQAIDLTDGSEVTKKRVVTVVENTEDDEVTKEITEEVTDEVVPVKTTKPQKQLRSGSKTVSTVSELEDAVNNASEDAVITLNPNGFTSANVTLKMPNVNVVIEGNNLTWANGKISVNNAGSGSLTIQNLTVDGTGFNDTLLAVSHSNGQLNLNHMTFTKATAGATNIATSNTAKTIFNFTMFSDNTAVNTAPALKVNGTSYVEINNSTVENSIGYGAGYECGAIASKQYQGTLMINNTIFRNNINRCSLSGPFGGGGGAMSMHYLQGKLIINESYFYKNQTNGSEGNVSSTFDGGAIYVIDGQAGATIDINKTTFDSNLAWDDGGAMMIQGTGMPGLATTITDCTFYNNRAYGLTGGNRSGGAIQFFKNGGKTTMTNKVEGTTFTGNISGCESTKVIQQGGAIGLSGAGFLAVAGLTYNNSLYIGNQVYGSDGALNTASNYKDVSSSPTTAVQKVNVVNADKGASPTTTALDAFGSYGASLQPNLTSVKVGVEQSPLKTVPIKPEGITDNKSANVISGSDGRNYTRYKDFGSVESSWIKYDANGGNFNLDALTVYDGSVYYEGTTPTTYYNVGVTASTSTVVGETTLDISAPTDKKFIGWSTDPNAKTAMEVYEPGKSITYANDNQTLYAIYGDKTYNVTYDGNESDGGTVPVDITKYNKDDDVIVKGPESMTRTNHKFIGWNTLKDRTGQSYTKDETFKITKDTTLFAQWEELYTVTFDSREGSAVPSQTGLDKGALVKEPTPPTRDGYEFTGWYKEPETTTKWKFNDDTIAGHTTLYAGWEELYTVTFDTQGGSTVQPQTGLKTGAYVNKPVEPVKEGYTFTGWYKEIECSTIWKFADDTISGHTTLYAKWNEIEKEKELYTVTFDSQGGSLVESQSNLEKGMFVKEPEIPTKKGYYFEGWYTEVEYETAWNFKQDVVSQDITLYAKWSKEIIVDPVEPNKPTHPSKKPNVILDNKKTEQPKTGDSTNLTKLLMLLGVSSIITVLVIMKKHNSNKK